MPFPPQSGLAILQQKLTLNTRFVHYFFEMRQPAQLTFQPGQYVSIQVSVSGERRSYSVVGAPAINHGFELLVDHQPAGIGSSFLKNLQLGDEIKILGPLGVFTLQPETKEFVFVATGSGVAPFRSMILHLLQEVRTTQPLILYWGLRTAQDMFWQAEFQELMTAFPNFKFHPTLSQGPQEWPLCRGRVTDCLANHELNLQAGYYVCGNAQMITDVKTTLQKRGVAADHIYHEKFY